MMKVEYIDFLRKKENLGVNSGFDPIYMPDYLVVNNQQEMFK